MLVGIVLLLVALSTTMAFKYRPLTVPYGHCSEVYRHYAGRADLDVAFVKGYRIGDSIAVDVTTITASDSASWERLLREMNVKEGTIDRMQKLAEANKTTMTMFRCQKNHPEINHKIIASPYDLVFCSPLEKNVYVFDITSDKQVEPLILVYFRLIDKYKKRNEATT